MSENEIWIWLVMGFIPYDINLQQVRSEQLLQIYALFWSFEIRPANSRGDGYSVYL